MFSPTSQSKSLAIRRYEKRVAAKGRLSKSDCARRLGVCLRQIDQFEVDGVLPFLSMGKHKRVEFEVVENLLPGGAASWLTVAMTADITGIPRWKLERMRKRGVGPVWRKFGKKLLRYDRQSVLTSKLHE